MKNWNMKANDNIIKKALQSRQQRIEDDSFSKRIVEIHLVKKQIIKNRPFVNFKSLIIGLSSVILSAGFVLIIRQNNDWIKEIGLTENHGLLILILSFMFLINKWIEEFNGRVCRYLKVLHRPQYGARFPDLHHLKV
jgi:hypothetical protein